uniref:SBP-type domain-containing protein n=1 Tax=Nelumbo nucifera TaxID=4432 RepID=A0A822Y4F4_NELNU|nr:TPA_asm: hypothetical protein HUJ06_028888 [Nelumbo nucifera]
MALNEVERQNSIFNFAIVSLIVRFHVLQEFDEGKRSCWRRLASHNRRRQKTHPDAAANGSSLTDDRASSYLLISLLRILSNMHCKHPLCNSHMCYSLCFFHQSQMNDDRNRKART